MKCGCDTKRTSASALTERLTIVTFVETDDGQGGVTMSPETLATVWGQMTPLSAAELLAADAVNSTQTYTARIRYRPDVTPKMQVHWTPYRYTEAKVLEIHGVLPDRDEPRRFLQLDIGEVVTV